MVIYKIMTKFIVIIFKLNAYPVLVAGLSFTSEIKSRAHKSLKMLNHMFKKQFINCKVMQQIKIMSVFSKRCHIVFIKKFIWASGQDGGVGRHSVPPCTTKRRTTIYLFIYFKIFYCYSITVVCLFSRALHPTPAEPTSLPQKDNNLKTKNNQN